MTETMPDADDDDDEAMGPSMASPPLYVLRTAARCPKCGLAQHVYALGCAAFHQAGDLRPVEDFHFLRQVSSIPKELTALLKKNCPSYFLDREDGDDRPYLMNHCRCGATLGDDYVSGDVGAAFWPDTPEGYGDFRLFRLPIEEAIPLESSTMLGGGEYLSFDRAVLW